jgi:ATP-binding cassette, subfamily C, bacterial CydD
MNIRKWLLEQTGNSRKYIMITVGLGLLSAILIIFQAQFLSQIIDLVFLAPRESRATDFLQNALLFLLVVIIGRAGLAWISEIAANRTAAYVKTRLREKLSAHLLKLGPAYTKNQRSGELANTALEGVENLDAYYSQYLPQIYLTVLVPLAVLVAVFMTDWLSGVVLLVTAPLLPFFMILVGKAAAALSRKQFQTLSYMSAHFLDVLQGLTTLKLLGRGKHQTANIAKISENFRVATLKVLRVGFLSAFVLEIGATISTAIIAVEIGFRLLYAQIPFQPALFVLLLAPEFYLPFRQLGIKYHAGQEGIAAGQRIFEILDAPMPVPPHPNPPPQGGMGHWATLKFAAVSFAYNANGEERQALQKVSFELKRGEIAALIGASGAGKSTVAQLLLRFIEPKAGTIWLDDTALTDIDPQDWRKQIAWVSQKPYLFNASVAENIKLGNPQATDEEVITAARLAHAHDFITAMSQGYTTAIGENGTRLSGGQAQRISLARAFLRNAPILLLDEATANLDPDNENAVMESINRLMEGRTVLMITHHLSNLTHADKIIHLNNGEITSITTEPKIVNRQSSVVTSTGRVAQ